MKKNDKKYLITLALLPAISALGAAAWLVIRDTPKLIASTRANFTLWTMMQSEDVTAGDIAKSPQLDKLTNDDLIDLIDESVICKKPYITAVLRQKLRERKKHL